MSSTMPYNAAFGSTCSSEISSLDTAASDVVEYTFTTDPDWASEAVVFTQTGIELNFERLSGLSANPPLKILITLHSSSDHVSHSSPISPTASLSAKFSSDEGIVSGHYTPTSTKHGSKLQELKTDYWRQQQESRGQQSSHPKFTRHESIIEREIRLQQERDNEFHIQKQFVKQASVTSPPPTPPPQSSGCTSPTNSSQHSFSSNDTSSKGGQKKQRPFSIVAISPVREPMKEAPTSSWYASESPIEKDIRITREREEAHKSARQQNRTHSN